MSVKVLRLGFLGLNSVKSEESKDYYTRVMGLPLITETPQETYFGCGFGSHALSLHKAEQSGFRHLGFQISGSGPLDDALVALQADGIRATIKSSSIYGVDSLIEISDPDGYSVLLYRDEISSQSNFPVQGIRPEKLGHVALWANEAKRSEKYYSEMFGFRTSDWIGNAFVFLRCNTDHHTVNFLTASRPGMFHFAFELRDSSHLIQTCDSLGKEKVRIDWGPGRHGPGHNLYTYHRDPEGNIVELFAELDMMSSEELGYFDPRPYHRDSPQRPKTWKFSPDIDIWGAPPPPDFAPPSMRE